MASDAPFQPAPRAVDERALARVMRRQEAAAQAPWLHTEVARRMADRLAIVKLQPARVLDWRAHAGGGAPALLAAYPKALRLAVERQAGADAPAPWWSSRRWIGARDGVLAEGEIARGEAQLVWANMALHSATDPTRMIRQWHQALAIDGFLMFSTLGPGTLPELQSLYRNQRWGPPMAPLVDMHDLGDMLVEAGFADPVMDQELITLTWASAEAALAELRELGANADPRRVAGLRTPRWRVHLLEALENSRSLRSDGRVGLTFELVYGHAFKPVPRARLAPESHVPLEDLRAMVRAGRRP